MRWVKCRRVFGRSKRKEFMDCIKKGVRCYVFVLLFRPIHVTHRKVSS